MNSVAGQSSSVCAWTTVVGFGLFFPSPTMPHSNWSEDLKQISYPQTIISSLSALTNVFSGSLLHGKLLAMPCNSYEFPLGMFTLAWLFSVGGHFTLRVHIQFSRI